MSDTAPNILTEQRTFAVEVVRKLREAGFESLWAGGCVRDLLLYRVPGDYDVATSAHPEDVRKVFGKRKTLAIGAAFGVIVVLPNKKSAGQIEVATFRSDGQYIDGRRPESVIFSSAEEDAQRRDFTVNGMFYDPIEEQVIDYVGGERDIGKRVIRAIGDPVARMTEDKLRMLRAIRFTSTLGFELEPETADAIRNMADQLNAVSAERIAQELRKMLLGPDPTLAIQLAEDVGLLHAFLPEISQSPDLDQTLKMLKQLAQPESAQPTFALAMATLLYSLTEKAASSVCRRLKLSNNDSTTTCWLVKHRDALDQAATLPMSRLKRLFAHSDARQLLELVRASRHATGSATADVEFCDAFLRDTPADEIDPPMLLTGDDLITMGFKPGKQFKNWIDSVRDEQLNGKITTREQAAEFARSIIGESTE